MLGFQKDNGESAETDGITLRRYIQMILCEHPHEESDLDAYVPAMSSRFKMPEQEVRRILHECFAALQQETN